MILSGSRPGCCRFMAIRTLRIGGLVCSRLALGVLSQIGAAVTGRTLSQPGVIHRRWRPAQEIAVFVAAVASTRYRNMLGRGRKRSLRCIGTTMAG